MAFFGNVGNIVRQITNRKISSELCSLPSVFQAIRCLSNSPKFKAVYRRCIDLQSTRCCVSYSTDEQSLREAFSKYGEVLD
ncbi:putative glycine-rich RNA-binding protein 3, mitochondrial, partial [Sesbania bispinosa]